MSKSRKLINAWLKSCVAYTSHTQSAPTSTSTTTEAVLETCIFAGPWKQLLDTSRDITFSVEVDDARRAAYKRASSSVKIVTERIRKDRAYAGSMMISSTLGPFAGSIGGFASQIGSIGAKVSASQYSLGRHFQRCCGKRCQMCPRRDWSVRSSVSAVPICDTFAFTIQLL